MRPRCEPGTSCSSQGGGRGQRVNGVCVCVWQNGISRSWVIRHELILQECVKSMERIGKIWYEAVKKNWNLWFMARGIRTTTPPSWTCMKNAVQQCATLFGLAPLIHGLRSWEVAEIGCLCSQKVIFQDCYRESWEKSPKNTACLCARRCWHCCCRPPPLLLCWCCGWHWCWKWLRKVGIVVMLLLMPIPSCTQVASCSIISSVARP